MTWSGALNVAYLLVALVLALGGGALFLSAGRQKGRITDLESDLADERARTAGVRLELADEVRRRESAEEKVQHCLNEQDSLRRELVALGKVVTAEAHLSSIDLHLAELTGKVDRVMQAVAS